MVKEVYQQDSLAGRVTALGVADVECAGGTHLDRRQTVEEQWWVPDTVLVRTAWGVLVYAYMQEL